MDEFAFGESELNVSDMSEFFDMWEALEPFYLSFAIVLPVVLGLAYVGARSLLRRYLRRESNNPQNRHPEIR